MVKTRGDFIATSTYFSFIAPVLGYKICKAQEIQKQFLKAFVSHKGDRHMNKHGTV